MGELSEIEKLCKKHNPKGRSLTHGWSKNWFAYFTVEPWEVTEAPFVNVTMFFMRGNVTMNWVLKTCPLNTQVWCKWRIHPTTVWEGLREKMTALWKWLWIKGRPEPCLRGWEKSILRNESDPGRITQMWFPRPVFKKRTHQKLVPDHYKVFMVHDEITKLRKV